MTPVRRIGATYRLQIRDVGFAGAIDLLPYLSALGIETLYCSPVFTARAGSTHGYDVVDPTTIDPALGGAAGFSALLAALEARGMNLLLDIVPNHLATGPGNAAFDGALQEGPSGAYSAWFDVDWADAGGKVVLPVLGDPLADALAAGAVAVAPDGTAIAAAGRVYPLCSPVSPGRARRPAREVAEILDRQHYRLAYWRLRTSELNYRRFFEVDELIALRQEDPAVYRATHELTIELAADPRVGGIRIDHVDGLTDPAGYLAQLVADLSASGDARPALLVEKVLEPAELLPRWPIEGTTGYDFARLALGLFVDADGAATLAEAYRARTGDGRAFATRQHDAKDKVLRELFPAQLARVAHAFADVVARVRPGADLARADVERALGALICALGVYRTYGSGSGPLARSDAALIRAAVARVRATVSPEVGRCATLLAELLATGIDGDDGPFADARRRFQQLAVAVMAKGSEDTALFDPGVGLCGVEVGGCPDAPAVSPEEFHAAMDARRARPLGLNATSTHDTKRSEDVRARLAVLSEQPSAWLVVLDRWRRSHASVRGSCGTAEEIYLYETIVGVAEPGRATSAGFRRRITEHMVKAAREAKRRTSWADPDAAFEGDLRQFVAAVLSPQNAPFHRDLGHLLDRIVDPARASALAMTVLKVAVPGIPDIYQGTEGGVASLTDPDNRRPAPFGALARTLGRPGGLRGSLAVGAVPDPRKLAVTSAVLGARRADPDLFDRGTYVPLATGGDHRERVIAFARTHRHRVAIAVVTRQVGRLAMVEGRVSSRAWGDTSVKLPAALTGRYVDACSGATVELAQITPVASLLARLPVAMLIRATTDR